jgi:DNA modification methylase
MMTPEQRQQLIDLLVRGEDISPEWSRFLFPPERREYELVYHGKERREDVIAETLSVPLQPVRTFNSNEVAWQNKLIFGDNLQAMKTLLEMKRKGELCNPDGVPGVRLVYIDPPFATRRDFAGGDGEKAFTDKVAGAQFIEFLRRRLIMLHELMADDGCIYVHLDWKRAAYIRVIMDEVFGERNFRNEIYWYYYNKMPDARNGVFPRATDTILFYAKDAKSDYRFFPQSEQRDKPVRQLLRKKANGRMINARDADGNLLYQTKSDRTVDNIWRIGLIPPANRSERTEYPTQKPEELLARIIRASTIEGDIVLDAFAGSGTTCAVAEKLGRRWIAIDGGKLAIYTIQKRMLTLKSSVGNKGRAIKAKPFTLFNAGLYDFASLRELPWEEWRRFALMLFGCQDVPQRIGGIRFDGLLKTSAVQVFDYRKQDGAIITEETVRSIHEAVGSKIGARMFIIAPAMAFGFQQDYLQIDEVRYYALRIPYSIINELHQRDFLALKQPTDELAVNNTVDAVGFDFIRTPDMEYHVGCYTAKNGSPSHGFIRIHSFYSEAIVREALRKRENRETLSMVMLDYDYDADQDVFDLDEVFYARAIEEAGWEVRFPIDRTSDIVMAVFVDIYGNESRVVIQVDEFLRRVEGNEDRTADAVTDGGGSGARPSGTRSEG